MADFVGFLTDFCVSWVIPKCSNSRTKSALMCTNFKTDSYIIAEKAKNHLSSKNLYHYSFHDTFALSMANNLPLSATSELQWNIGRFLGYLIHMVILIYFPEDISVNSLTGM